MRETDLDVTRVDAYRAADLALREAGGGRLAGVRTAHEFGRLSYQVQFVRDTWLCTATVDADTGEVTAIVDDGAWTPEPGEGEPPVVLTAALEYRTAQDVRAAADDPALAYVATDTGVGVLRLSWALIVEDHHTTGLGPTRQVAPVAGGVAGATAEGGLFRLDRSGRLRWLTRLPAAAYTIADGRVFTCAGGTHVDRHSYATAGYEGRLAELPSGPEAITVLRPGGGAEWLLTGHRDGVISARPVTPAAGER